MSLLSSLFKISFHYLSSHTSLGSYASFTLTLTSGHSNNKSSKFVNGDAFRATVFTNLESINDAYGSGHFTGHLS